MNDREKRDFEAGLNAEIDAFLRGENTRRSFIKPANSTSVADAVVVAEYCGYIGSTISRSTPSWIIAATTSPTAGLPTCMPKRTGTPGNCACNSSAWRRVWCNSGEPVRGSQMR